MPRYWGHGQVKSTCILPNGNGFVLFGKVLGDGTRYDTVFLDRHGHAIQRSWIPGSYTSAIQSDGPLLVGGLISSFRNGARNSVVRLNINGTLDGVFDPSTQPIGLVSLLATGANNGLLVGGMFSDIDVVSVKGLARLVGSTGLIWHGDKAYQKYVTRVWAKLMRLQGASLTQFTGDASTFFANVANPIEEPVASTALNLKRPLAILSLTNGPVGYEQIIITPVVRAEVTNSVQEVRPKAPSLRSEQRRPVKLTEALEQVREDELAISILWKHPADLDLWVWAGEETEPLCYLDGHRNSREGWYNFDHREATGRGEVGNLEDSSFVVLNAGCYSLPTVRAWVNFYGVSLRFANRRRGNHPLPGEELPWPSRNRSHDRESRQERHEPNVLALLDRNQDPGHRECFLRSAYVTTLPNLQFLRQGQACSGSASGRLGISNSPGKLAKS